jgi:7-cyano-7-deazaguanine synthase in queuosine biosynthesis
MKVDDFFEWATDRFTEEMEIMNSKGKEYTISDEDKLKNFKSIAERIGISPEKVIMVYLLKHFDSICNYILTNEVYSEPIDGRIMDARNYLLLLQALISEQVISTTDVAIGQALKDKNTEEQESVENLKYRNALRDQIKEKWEREIWNDIEKHFKRKGKK